MAEEEKNDEAAEEENAGGGKKKLILLVVGALVLVAGAVGTTVLVMGGGEEQEVAEEVVEEPLKEPIYIALDPTFVVNYKDADARNRFLKAELNLMTYENEVEDTVSKHMPLIRGKLVSLFNKQTFEDLLHQEGKDAFREAALAEVQSVMESHLGKPGVEQVYFTTFVMQ
ncbi:MAG: flagellar basal body-associated FliL family protein [Pseudomonadota bacterium]